MNTLFDTPLIAGLDYRPDFITPGDQLRFSITFRTLSDRGRTIAQRSS